MDEEERSEKKPIPPGTEDGSLPTTFDPLRKYLSEVSRYSVLSREEEFEIARRVWEDKDRLAAQKSTSRAWSWEIPEAAPLRSIQARARRLASNSTGRVTSANKVEAAKRRTPAPNTQIFPPAVARPTPAMMIQGARVLPNWTTGTRVERSASIG